MNRCRRFVVPTASMLIAAAGVVSPSASASIVTPIAVTEATQTHASLGPGQGTATFNITSTSSNINWGSQISNAGIVSFRGSSTAATISNSGNGIWANTGSGNSSIAFAGGAEVGGGTFGANTYSNKMSRSGNAIFSHSSGSNVNSGIVAGPITGPLARAGYVGDIAPGTGGATYNTATTPTAFATSIFPNNAGQVLFQGAMTAGTGSPVVNTTANTANNIALFLGTAGAGNPNPNAVPVLRMNDDISSLVSRPSGATGTLNVGTITSGLTSFNDNGKFLTLAAFQSTGASDLVTNGTGNDNLNNNSALLTNRNGSLQALARRGDFCPDSTGAISTNRYGTISAAFTGLNNNGRVAFQTRLTNITGTTVTSVAAAALFSDHDNNTGTIKELARTNTLLPNIYDPSDTGHTTPLTAKFGGRLWGGGMTARIIADNSLIVSGSGFGGSGGTSTAGVFRRDVDGYWSSLYSTGDVAVPGGASDGSNVLYGVQQSAPTVNSVGQIAMLVNLTGTGIQAGNRNNLMLIATDPAGALVQVARLGDFWDYYGDGSDFRQIVGIQSLTQNGPQDGSGSIFNDYGKLVFELQFGNPNIGQPSPIITSSGVYTIWIPTPGAAGLLALGGLIALRRRRSVN